MLLCTEHKCLCIFRDDVSFAGNASLPFPSSTNFLLTKMKMVTIAFCWQFIFINSFSFSACYSHNINVAGFLFVCLFVASVGCGMILLSSYRLHRESLGKIGVECRGCNVFIAPECSKVYWKCSKVYIHKHISDDALPRPSNRGAENVNYQIYPAFVGKTCSRFGFLF